MVNASTEVTPFFADTGWHPHTGLEPSGELEDNLNPRIGRETLKVNSMAQRLEDIAEYLKANLA
jgi:hypothetical protein